MKRTLIIIVASIIVTSCVPKLTPSQNAFVLCSGYASALSALAVHRAAGRLSEGSVTKVNATREILNPLCRNAERTIDDVQKIRDGMKVLLDIKESADG